MQCDQDISYLYQIYNRCPCGEKFDTKHAMSCKKGGFMTLRHNKLREITGAFLEKVCHELPSNQFCKQFQIIIWYHQQQTQTMVPD